MHCTITQRPPQHLSSTMGDVAVTLVSGALAGAFADLVTHPVCTVKARLMAQGASKASTAGGNGAHAHCLTCACIGLDPPPADIQLASHVTLSDDHAHQRCCKERERARARAIMVARCLNNSMTMCCVWSLELHGTPRDVLHLQNVQNCWQSENSSS